MVRAEDVIRAQLLDRRIVRVDSDGSELRELELDDGTVLGFRWRVGSEPDRVGVRVRPGRRRAGGGILEV